MVNVLANRNAAFRDALTCVKTQLLLGIKDEEKSEPVCHASAQIRAAITSKPPPNK